MTRTRLSTLCAHTYAGMTAVIEDCTRCGIGWDKKTKTCQAYLGVEHFPLVAAGDVPDCPLQDRCQHQTQQTEPCKVRARGLICESALRFAGIVDAENHPLAFNANTAATPEELEST